MDPYSDPANNPYNEGGSTRSGSVAYWCHECSSRIPASDVLRVPDLTCPRCNGSFLEEIQDGDPNAPGAATEEGFGIPFFATGEEGHTMPMGGAGFGGLFQQLLGAMNEGMDQMRVPSPQPPGGQSSPMPPRFQNLSGTSSQAASGRESPSGEGTSRPHSRTFIFRSGPSADIGGHSGSPPPRGMPANNPSVSQPQSPSANVPIHNLAQFLNEAFSEGPQQASNQSRLRESEDRRPQPTQREPQDDIFTNMLGAIARAAGVPIGEAPSREQPSTQSTGSDSYARSGTGFTFTWSSGNGMNWSTHHGSNQGNTGEGNTGMPIPFPFAMFMGGEGDGRMGDYVFSQGAMDNIISDLLNQAAGRDGPQRAPEEMINALPTFKMTADLLKSDEIADCAICKDDFEEDNDVLKLPCTHIFHPDCIKPWLSRSGTCPVCRYALVEQPSSAPMGANMANSPQGARGPTSPTTPAIDGGSRMPGSLPTGFPFNLFSRSNSNRNQNQNPTSSTDTQASRSNQQSSRSGREEPQGQPDLDLDLD